jgi:hypothetical protein
MKTRCGWALRCTYSMAVLALIWNGLAVAQVVTPSQKQPVPVPASADKEQPKKADPAKSEPKSEPTVNKPSAKDGNGKVAPTGSENAADQGSKKPAANTPAGNEGGKDQASPTSDKAVAHKVMLEESKHRQRIARINRLRELAKAQNNQERLAALDKLEAKANQLHDRKVAEAKSKLGDEKFKEVDKRLNKGRGHGNPHGVPPGLAKQGVTEHPGQKGLDTAAAAQDEHNPKRPDNGDAGKPKDNGKENGKDKDKDKDKEKGDKPGNGKGKGDGNKGGGKP